jgi:hypothetical protein
MINRGQEQSGLGLLHHGFAGIGIATGAQIMLRIVDGLQQNGLDQVAEALEPLADSPVARKMESAKIPLGQQILEFFSRR